MTTHVPLAAAPNRRQEPGARSLAWATATALVMALLAACGESSGDGPDGAARAAAAAPGGFSGGGVANAGESVQAFAQTVFPLLSQHCSDCHAGSGPGSPHIAHADIATAHAAVVDNQKVSLSTPINSRLVRRLAADFHYCWSNCVSDAAVMQAAIESWSGALSLTSAPATQVASLASETLTLADGVEDEGQDRSLDHAVAYWEFKEGSGEVAQDQSGVDPPLDLTLSGEARFLSSHGIQFEGGMASASPETSRKLYERIAEPGRGTQQYSIEAWVTPANIEQEGPARIVSYSRNTGSRNFTLGQIMYTYDVRNRSVNPEISGNGTPSLQTYDADQDAQAALQHVVVTYDGYRGRRIYVDGVFTDDVDELEAQPLWNWDPEHRLVLGNEVGGSRPWQGQIRLLAIYEHVLSEAQILQNLGAGVGKRLLMRFDLSSWAGPGAYIEFIVSELDDYSYLFCEPAVVAPNASNFRVANLRVAVNGVIPVSGQAFINVDSLVTQSRQQLSRQCSVILKDAGPAADVFSIEFEYLGDFENPVLPVAIPAPPVPTFGPPLPVEGFRSFDRIQETLATLTGVDPTTPSVQATFDEITQQLPSSFDLRSFASANQVAISKLALEYCDAMVESVALREAFFGTSPGIEFDSPATQAFSDPARRDRLIDPLIDRMIGTNLAVQPDPSDLRPVLDGLVDDLLQGCDPTSCAAEHTRTVTKAACAAVLASAAVSIH
jgi:hypothetical protein